MQLDAILEVAIGLIMTWLILSMAASQIQEAIIELLGWRSKFLEDRLLEMFNKNSTLVAKFYKHPLIEALFVKTMFNKTRKPADIPNPIFAKAAVDILLNAGKSGDEVPAGSMSLETMKHRAIRSMEHLKQSNEYLANTVKYLVPRLDEAEAKVEQKLVEYRGNVKSWFDTTMVEATNLYRKYASAIALGLGIGLAMVFNVDSVEFVNQLWRDPTLRQTIVAQAGNIKPEDSASIAKGQAGCVVPARWLEPGKNSTKFVCLGGQGTGDFPDRRGGFARLPLLV